MANSGSGRAARGDCERLSLTLTSSSRNAKPCRSFHLKRRRTFVCCATLALPASLSISPYLTFFIIVTAFSHRCYFPFNRSCQFLRGIWRRSAPSFLQRPPSTVTCKVLPTRTSLLTPRCVQLCQILPTHWVLRLPQTRRPQQLQTSSLRPPTV